MLKYKTGYMREIEKVEVDRETTSSIWIKNQRTLKITDWHSYHDTWEDAHNYLLMMANKKCDTAQRRLDYETSERDRIMAMEKPK